MTVTRVRVNPRNRRESRERRRACIRIMSIHNCHEFMDFEWNQAGILYWYRVCDLRIFRSQETTTGVESIRMLTCCDRAECTRAACASSPRLSELGRTQGGRGNARSRREQTFRAHLGSLQNATFPCDDPRSTPSQSNYE